MRALFLVLALSACAPRIIYRPVALPLPPKPVFRVVSGADMACLSDDAYRRILERDRQAALYERQLEAVICSTRPKPCP